MLGHSRLLMWWQDPGTCAKKLQNCWRCEFMKIVKKEEEPLQYGPSHTRPGMEKSLEKAWSEAQPDQPGQCLDGKK